MEETEIIKTPSVRGSPKEPSIRSTQSPKEPSIRSTQSPKEPSIRSAQSPKEPNVRSTPSPRQLSIRSIPSPKEHSIRSTQSPKEPSIRSAQSPKEPSIKSAQSPKEPNVRLPSPRQLSIRSIPSPKEPSIRSAQSPKEPNVPSSPSPRQPSIRSILSPKESSIKSVHSEKEPSVKSIKPPLISEKPEPGEFGAMSPSLERPLITSSPTPPSRLATLLNSPIKSPNYEQASPKSNKSPSSKLQVPRSPNLESNNAREDLIDNDQNISEHIDELKDTIRNLSRDLEAPQKPIKINSNIEKIANMSKQLTQEANSLRESVKHLSRDIAKTKNEWCICCDDEEVGFPYHLFLIEIVINKISMKCECFDVDYSNLVISASFLGKNPIVLYDPSYGKIESTSRLNVGKSTLFAMTYDKICAIKEFEIILQLTKQPPCSSCVTKIAETCMDYTKDFVALRDELCRKWRQQQPKDDIQCNTSTPLSKNMYYLSCGEDGHQDSIGVIEVSVRMSFLGKEITTAFCASPKPQAASFLLKEDNGMSMYSCHKVEMDNHGKILLDEDVMTKKSSPRSPLGRYAPRSESPVSHLSSIISSKRSVEDPPVIYPNNPDGVPKYDEIFTKMNANELKIRVPKSTKIERMGKYDKIQELCSCESTPYNAGEQIQFELPKDLSNNTHTSNLKYTYRGGDNRRHYDNKERKVVNVTPTDCPVAVDMEKMIHPQKDVFILKIGKKLETKDKKTDLEIELITPKAPSDKPIENTHISQQCSSPNLKEDKKEKKKKPKGKGKDKGKGKNKGKGKKDGKGSKKKKK